MPHPANCDCSAQAASIANAESLHECIQAVEIFGAHTTDSTGFRQLLRNPALRFDNTCNVEADDDDELSISVYFQKPCTLHAITILCEEGRWCDKMKLYRDEVDVDFQTLSDKGPIQELNVSVDPCGRLPHLVKAVKFRNAHSITMLIKQSGIRLQHIGLFGEISKYVREGPKNLVYEARANPADHSVHEVTNMSSKNY